MTEDERYDLMVDEIYDLKNTILNFQTILKKEGFDDIESMIAKYKYVLYDSNEIAIQKDEQIESLNAQLKECQEQRDKAVEDIPHNCGYCQHALCSGACKLLPDGDEFSPDYTEGFDRDNCEYWEWRGLGKDGKK